jgi:hypothetical protein
LSFDWCFRVRFALPLGTPRFCRRPCLISRFGCLAVAVLSILSATTLPLSYRLHCCCRSRTTSWPRLFPVDIHAASYHGSRSPAVSTLVPVALWRACDLGVTHLLQRPTLAKQLDHDTPLAAIHKAGAAATATPAARIPRSRRSRLVRHTLSRHSAAGTIELVLGRIQHGTRSARGSARAWWR